MEIVELIWALVQGCGCALELLTAVGWVGAGRAGLKVRKKLKERQKYSVQPMNEQGRLYPHKDETKGL